MCLLPILQVCACWSCIQPIRLWLIQLTHCIWKQIKSTLTLRISQLCLSLYRLNQNLCMFYQFILSLSSCVVSHIWTNQFSGCGSSMNEILCCANSSSCLASVCRPSLSSTSAISLCERTVSWWFPRILSWIANAFLNALSASIRSPWIANAY